MLEGYPTLTSVTKLLDDTSPKLLLGVHLLTHYKYVTMVVRATPGKYLEIDLTNPFIVSDQAGVGVGQPTEVLTLDFQKISFVYKSGKITSTSSWQNS